MYIFMKLGEIKGGSVEAAHPEWIRLNSITTLVTWTPPKPPKDATRNRGETTLGDYVVVKEVDKATPLLAAACANGRFIPEAQIDFCEIVYDKFDPYLILTLKNVLVTSHKLHGNAVGNPPVAWEKLTLHYTDVGWKFLVLDPNTGSKKGAVEAKYSAGNVAS